MKRSIEMPNYSQGEGMCPDGCGEGLTDDLILRQQALVMILSRAYGSPVRHIMSSGARCLKHNRTLVDAKGKRISSDTSRHIGGGASDGVFEYFHGGKWHRIDNADVAAAAVKSGLFGGVGYRDYARKGIDLVHLDNRPGPCVTW